MHSFINRSAQFYKAIIGCLMLLVIQPSLCAQQQKGDLDQDKNIIKQQTSLVTVDVTVTVTELVPEKFRARLRCECSVGGEIVLDGEALVKVPSKNAEGRPQPRL